MVVNDKKSWYRNERIMRMTDDLHTHKIHRIIKSKSESQSELQGEIGEFIFLSLPPSYGVGSYVRTIRTYIPYYNTTQLTLDKALHTSFQTFVRMYIPK